MKKLLSRRIILSVLISVLVITMIPATIAPVHANSTVTSGTCGENVNWTYIDYPYNLVDTLHISGSGDMYDYSGQNAPWHSYDYYDEVNRIMIGDNVTKLGNRAFYGFTGLTSIEWGTGLKEIGNYTFYNCTSLNNVVVPEPVSTIGKAAFYGCNSVTFPDTLEIIKEDALRGIKNVTIPANVKTLETQAYGGTKGVETITIKGDIENVAKDALAWHVSPTSPTLKTVVFEDGVTTVPAGLFLYQNKLTDLTLPETLKEIQEKAFSTCFDLKYVRIPGSVKK